MQDVHKSVFEIWYLCGPSIQRSVIERCESTKLRVQCYSCEQEPPIARLLAGRPKNCTHRIQEAVDSIAIELSATSIVSNERLQGRIEVFLMDRIGQKHRKFIEMQLIKRAEQLTASVLFEYYVWLVAFGHPWNNLTKSLHCSLVTKLRNGEQANPSERSIRSALLQIDTDVELIEVVLRMIRGMEAAWFSYLGRNEIIDQYILANTSEVQLKAWRKILLTDIQSPPVSDETVGKLAVFGNAIVDELVEIIPAWTCEVAIAAAISTIRTVQSPRASHAIEMLCKSDQKLIAEAAAYIPF